MVFASNRRAIAKSRNERGKSRCATSRVRSLVQTTLEIAERGGMLASFALETLSIGPCQGVSRHWPSHAVMLHQALRNFSDAPQYRKHSSARWAHRNSSEPVGPTFHPLFAILKVAFRAFEGRLSNFQATVPRRRGKVWIVKANPVPLIVQLLSTFSESRSLLILGEGIVNLGYGKRRTICVDLSVRICCLCVQDGKKGGI